MLMEVPMAMHTNRQTAEVESNDTAEWTLLALYTFVAIALWYFFS
jgi:hypothetical protein